MSVEKLRLLGASRPVPFSLEQRVLAAAGALFERRLVVGSVGNVSARMPGGFLITPTRMPYHEMRGHDLVPLNLHGKPLAPSDTAPSQEWPLHAAIYRARADVSAVVHTHSVYATAWSFLPDPLESRLEESAYYDVGPIATSAPAPAGSGRLAAVTVAALGASRAALLGRHGVVAVGATPDDALTVAEVVEREAQVAWLLRAACAAPSPS
jgi:L-fuculose-phosphate aldolase